jgi:hypothetical protein
MGNDLTIRPMKFQFIDEPEDHGTELGYIAWWSDEEWTGYGFDKDPPTDTKGFVLWLARQEDLPESFRDAIETALNPSLKAQKTGPGGFQGPRCDWVSTERFLKIVGGQPDLGAWCTQMIESWEA